jgi:uncharacterized protein YdeI (YjbR/CyaY-like superfamily)
MTFVTELDSIIHLRKTLYLLRMKLPKSLDEYFEKLEDHVELVLKLRAILLKTTLTETLKWGLPTYQVNGKNVVGIGSFKAYAGLWFFNGVFLNDKANVLINAQDGKTKGMRQWRFESMKEINEGLILEYVFEAIQNQKAGKEVKAEKKPLLLPDELKEALAADSNLSESFDTMSLTLRREYAEYISEAKRAQTKADRLAKIIPMIKKRIGLNDGYRK